MVKYKNSLFLALFMAIICCMYPAVIYAYGESGSEYVSGPSGTKVGVWHKDSFSIQFYFRNDVGAECSPQSTGLFNWSSQGAPSGMHTYRFLRYNHTGAIWYQIDGGGYQAATTPSGDPNCNIQLNASTQIFSTTVYLDKLAPTIAFDSSLANLRTKDSGYTLTGSFSDDTTSAKTVTINGSAAGGGSDTKGVFSSYQALKDGANVFTATVVDDVGHTTTSAPITVYRDSDSSSASAGSVTQNSSTPTTPSEDAKSPSTAEKSKDVLSKDGEVANNTSEKTADKTSNILVIVLVALGLIGLVIGLLIKFGVIKASTLKKVSNKLRLPKNLWRNHP